MAYYDALIAKWPSLTGTTQQKLDQVNAEKADGPAIPMIVPTHKFYNLIVPSEFDAVSNANQTIVRDIISMGEVDASAGTNVRSRMLGIFGAGTQTRANLTALAAPYDKPQITWCRANGYPEVQRPTGTIGGLTMVDVQAAGLS